MTRDTKISYTLPYFDDWHRKPEDRIELEVNAYVDGIHAGRGVYLTGSVTWRTRSSMSRWQTPHEPDSWKPWGDYLYRVSETGSMRGVTDLKPTRKMCDTVRDAVFYLLEPPSDEMRLRVAVEQTQRIIRLAGEEMARKNKEATTFLQRLEDAVGVPLGTAAQVAAKGAANE